MPYVPCSVLSAEVSGTEKAHSLLAVVTREEPNSEERARQCYRRVLRKLKKETKNSTGGDLGRWDDGGGQN